MTSRFVTVSAALLILGGTPAVAQTNDWLAGTTAYAPADDYRTSYADAQRQAYDNGYRDGIKRGEEAARDRKPFNVEVERDYRSADRGYNRSFGDRNRYHDSYRGGFSQGYRDAYARYGGNANGGWNNRGAVPRDNRGWRNGNYPNGNYPNGNYPYGNYPNGNYGNYGYGNANYGAYQNGLSDGYQKGLDDVHDRKRADVTRQKWYRSGDHDYNSNYGSKDAYRVEYRRGFEEGYNRAYRDGRRY